MYSFMCVYTQETRTGFDNPLPKIQVSHPILTTTLTLTLNRSCCDTDPGSLIVSTVITYMGSGNARQRTARGVAHPCVRLASASGMPGLPLTTSTRLGSVLRLGCTSKTTDSVSCVSVCVDNESKTSPAFYLMIPGRWVFLRYATTQHESLSGLGWRKLQV